MKRVGRNFIPLFVLICTMLYNSSRMTVEQVKPATMTTKEADPSSFLQRLLDERGQTCGKKIFGRDQHPNSTTYLAVARVASETLYLALAKEKGRGGKSEKIWYQQHDHGCTLRDMEERGARRVLVALRYPLARILSGINRRLEGNAIWKPSNALFYETFGGHEEDTKAAESYFAAFRNESDPLHGLAYNITVCPYCMNFILPYSFYLEGSLGLADVAFLCMETLEEDFKAAILRWRGGGPEAKNFGKNHHASKHSSSNVSMLYSRFSEESIDWVERAYASDIALYRKHCPEGFSKYDRTTTR